MANTRYHSQLGHTIESLTLETHILLQLLADWSHGDATTKPQIYDGYVNMQTAFVACIYAFEEHGVDMTTPQQIWDQLERMLAMETAPHTRDVYLPSIQSSAQLLLQDLRAKRRESYRLSRIRKRESLASNASSTASTLVEMEREQTLLRLNGHGTYRDLEVQHPDVVVLTHRSVSRYSSTTTIPQSNSSTIVDAFFACDNGEKYVCAACGTVCLEPIRDAVDSFTSSSLELMGLLEKWRQDPALAVNLYLSCMRVSQDYDAAVEVFGNRGAYVADLKPIVQELKDAVKKAAYFPYRCGHDDLRTQILSEASNSIKQLNHSLKSGQRKYMLKHAPAIAPTITRLLSCLKNLCKVLLNWSHGKADRVCVNRACAVLDRAFKVVVSAFYARGMDVSDIVPSSSSQLNGALQDLLAEEPSSENWKKHQLVIGAVVKKLLKSVLDLGVGDHMAVEVWWSVVGLSGQDETNGVDTNPVDYDSGSVAAQCSAGLGTENSPVTPQVVSPLLRSSPKLEEEALTLDYGRTDFEPDPLFKGWKTSSISLSPAPVAHLDGPAVGLLVASAGLEVSHEASAKGGVLGTTLRRMSGRISSMFNLRDVKGRYRRLPA